MKGVEMLAKNYLWVGIWLVASTVALVRGALITLDIFALLAWMVAVISVFQICRRYYAPVTYDETSLSPLSREEKEVLLQRFRIFEMRLRAAEQVSEIEMVEKTGHAESGLVSRTRI